MEKSQIPSQNLLCKQVLKCPKCKIGTFISSADPDKFYICDNCGHTLWNGKQPDKHQKIKK